MAKTRNLLVPLVLGVGLTLSLLWLLGARLAPVAAAPTQQASGDVITVCLSGDCDYAAIQEAVDAAHEGDIIKVAAGTYADTVIREPTLSYSPTGVITQVVYISKTLTIQGGYTTTDHFAAPDPDTYISTLDAEGQGGKRVIFVGGEGIVVTLENLRITGGDATGLGGDLWGNDAGGGVYIVSTTATISGCQVTANTAAWGGGIFLYDSDGATLSGNTIYSNTADGGGGIELDFSDDVTLSGNDIYSNTAAIGGGLCNYRGTLIVTDSVLRDNTATDGGGLYNLNGRITINNSTISHNIARGENAVGGGVFNGAEYSDATLELNNSLVMSNTMDGIGGGGMGNYVNTNCTATMVLNNSIVQGNVATGGEFTQGFGGGISNGEYEGAVRATGLLTLNNSTVTGNRAINGGGIGNGSQILGAYTLMTTLNNSTVSGNTAEGVIPLSGNGGGLFNINGTLSVINSTVSGNAASGIAPESSNGLGGGIANAGAGVATTARLNNSTIADNTAASGGALANAYILPFGRLPTATVTFRNSLIAGNSDTAGYPGCLNDPRAGAAILTSLDHNLEDGDTCHLDQPHDLPSTADPGLDVLQDNGGDTWTHALLSGSPAIDAVPVVSCTVSADQRGVPRPQGAACDIGAYEAQADLRIAKSVVPESAASGEAITYTLTFSNAGATTAPGVVITDIIPASVSDASVTSSGAIITDTGHVPAYVWEVQDLAPGEFGIIVIAGVLGDSLPFGEVLINTATIAAAGVDADVSDNSAEAAITTTGYRIYLPLVMRNS